MSNLKIELRRRGATNFSDGDKVYPVTSWNHLVDKPTYYNPASHTHPWSDITSKPTTLAGYGITDAYTESEVDAKIANLVDSSPDALDTLNELAAALGDDPNFATTMTNALAGKLDKTGGSISGQTNLNGSVYFNGQLYWKPGINFTLNATANGQEWSFDLRRNGYTGTYWHVWDSGWGTLLKVNADDGRVTAYKTLYEGSNRVYSAANKPTPSAIGALGVNEKAADSNKLDGLNSTDFSRVYAYGAQPASGHWYTIAHNSGNRASARFILIDKTSGQHQSIHFYAQHHYGTDSSNQINVIANSAYGGGGPFRYIRILEAGTYDGAYLQVYLDHESTDATIYMFENYQTSGWTLIDWSEQDTISGFSERVKIDLDLTNGINVTDDIYAKGQVVILGNDSRLTNARPASDVYSWAKASTKPTYTASEVGARADNWVPSWSQVTSKPSTFTPSSHSHSATEITSGLLSTDRLPTIPTTKLPMDDVSSEDVIWSGETISNAIAGINYADVGARSDTWVPSWSQVTSKPSTFTPSSHSHTKSEITDFPTTVSTFSNDAGYITGNQTITLTGDVSGSGSTSITVTVADDSHNHIISNIDGLQSVLDTKLATTGKAADANLLDGHDSTYFANTSHPLGGLFRFRYSSSTTAGDPGTGYFRFNSTTMSSVTTMYIDDSDANSKAMYRFIQNFTGILTIFGTDNGHEWDHSEMAVFYIDGTTDQSGYTTVELKYIRALSDAIDNGDYCYLQFTPLPKATNKIAGGLKARLSGSTLYLRSDGSDA